MFSVNFEGDSTGKLEYSPRFLAFKQNDGSTKTSNRFWNWSRLMMEVRSKPRAACLAVFFWFLDLVLVSTFKLDPHIHPLSLPR